MLSRDTGGSAIDYEGKLAHGAEKQAVSPPMLISHYNYAVTGVLAVAVTVY